jgi:hypothetical protein
LVAATVMVDVGSALAAFGDITTFSDPTGNVSGPRGITDGLGDGVWFTSTFNNQIGRIAGDRPRAPAADARSARGGRAAVHGVSS